MLYVVTCAFAGCAKRFETQHNKVRYCSRGCGNRGRASAARMAPAALRFHVNRAGGRTAFARLAGCGKHTPFKHLPQDETDAYHRGELTTIGGILVKKCNRCEVARQLDSYHVDNQTTSGCRSVCAICREKEDAPEYYQK